MKTRPGGSGGLAAAPSHPNGSDLGHYNTSVPGPWGRSDVLYKDGRPKWRITVVVELDSSV